MMVSLRDSGLRGPLVQALVGLIICVVISHCLSPPTYPLYKCKWVPVNYQGNLAKFCPGVLGGVHVVILLVVS